MRKDKTIIIRVSESEYDFLKKNIPYSGQQLGHYYGNYRPMNMTTYIRFCILKDLLNRQILSPLSDLYCLDNFTHVNSNPTYNLEHLFKVMNSK